jgi:hypothetical protein
VTFTPADADNERACFAAIVAILSAVRLWVTNVQGGRVRIEVNPR